MMNAVATLLFSPDYLPGALVLGHLLRKIVDKETKLVILIDQSAFNPLHLHLLHQLWDDVRDTQVYLSQLHQKLLNDLKRPELAATFTKVQLWDLPYEKVLYLDADTLPLIGSGSNVTDLLKLNFPAGKILAAPDSGFPDVFNSGVFVLRPNQHDYQSLVSLVCSNDQNISFDGADQGLLNQYFNSDPDWVSQLLQSGDANCSTDQFHAVSNWVKIPFLFNTTPNAQYQYAPAFNHFQTPVSEQYAPDGSKDVLNDGDKTAETSAVDAASAYQSTALSYFLTPLQGNQVKLVHFIGPIKPWKNESSGLFSKWWKEWYEYSNGKLLYETLYRQFYDIKVTALKIPGQEDKEAVSIENYYPALVHSLSLDCENKTFSPADLCDPNNYQQFASEPVNSHSTWDATREQPPNERPDLSSFDADIMAFNSSWDAPSSSSEQETTNSVSDETYLDPLSEPLEVIDQSTSDIQEEFGYHKQQKAERSFEESQDYTPTHYLLERQKDAKNASKINVVVDMVTDIKLEDQQEQLVEAEIKDDIQIAEREVATENVDTGVRKLFPWEFREAKASERCWD